MKFNLQAGEDKFERIASAIGLKSKTGPAVIDYLFELNSRIAIPHHLKDIGVKQEHIETLADLAIADFAHPNNPIPVTRDNFKKLYLEAF
jgi:alcohol dehydrogenase class IV